MKKLQVKIYRLLNDLIIDLGLKRKVHSYEFSNSNSNFNNVAKLLCEYSEI